MTSATGKSLKGRVSTLSGLARQLGLSPTTVSFVLNGQARERKIAPRTVKRILAAAEDMDYVPNALARGLRQKRTHAIGVVFPHLRSDWAYRIMQGIADGLGDSGTVPLIVCHYGSGDLERQLLRSLVERRVDGIICNPLPDGFNRYRQVVERGVPLVFLSDAPRGLDEISYTAWDPAAVGLVVRHLIDLGHRHIAYLGVRDNRRMSTASRHAYRDTLEEAGLECSRHDIVLNEPGAPFEESVKELLARKAPPTALFAQYDDIAINVLRMMEAKGVRCPEDVSVATLGDSPLVTSPGYGITTVAPPVTEEGRACAGCLMQIIENPKQGPIHRLVPGGQLVVGRTTGPCRP